ncbi:MAG: hypothetical protein ACOX86_04630 [Pelotomaculaceae bacterium]|jgi:hypothetical protein
MQWQGLKIPLIIVSLLAGLALIFGVQWLYQKYNYQEPLNAILSQNDAIESFQIKNEGRQLQVHISIQYDQNLMQAYKEINKELTRTMGRKSFQIILEDNPDEVLNQVWYKAQYAIYQAAFQGSFQDMALAVNREALASGVATQINLDQENIYIRLKHQGHTYDEIIPLSSRQVSGTAQVPAAGGDSSVQGN